MRNVPTGGTQHGNLWLELHVRGGRLERMVRMMAMSHTSKAWKAKIKVVADGACNKLGLRQDWVKVNERHRDI